MSTQVTSGQPLTPTNNLCWAALIAVVTIIGILLIYHQTAWSMVSIWNRSETYAHGFLIAPFSIYMIWTRRHYLMTLTHQSNFFALLVLGALGCLWLVATLASVQILSQYVLVMMIPAVVWAILGSRLLIAASFPLAYLVFAVPFGDVLLAPLINLTADFTVSALQLSGIPVYREGSFFSLPTGNWSVVEACSGLRYLIASVTLGTLYAYLTYHSISRRLAFIALSIIVPIIANWIRAYLIVMTGHFSSMKLAVGADHLVYGWVFFGFVMLLLFWVGSLWREDSHQKETAINLQSTSCNQSLQRTILTACAVLIIAFIWPSYATYLDKDNDFERDANIVVETASIAGNWIETTRPISDWEPTYVGSPVVFRQSYRYTDQVVSLYITYYQNQQQGDELINSGNILVAETSVPWKNVGEAKYMATINSKKFGVRQTQLHAHSLKLLVWRWYWFDNEETTSPFIAKAILARNKLLSQSDSGAEIIIASTYRDDPKEAVIVLQQFIKDIKPAIIAGLLNAESN